MHRPRSAPALTAAVTALTLAVLAALAGCSSSSTAISPATSAKDLATRAQAGLLQSYTATYAVTSASGAKGDTLTVWRTPNQLRLDVGTSNGIATSITDPTSTVACQRGTDGSHATCLIVAGPGKTPPAAFDPALRKDFGDVLRVLASSNSGLHVDETKQNDAPSDYPTATPSGVSGIRCFVVSAGTGTAVVADGTYCLDANGVPVSLEFPSGDANLTSLTPGTPAANAFTPPAKPTPLP